jgi:hypothetical protein
MRPYRGKKDSMTQENQEVTDATVSRIVHFLIESHGELRCRPAMVVEDWNGKSNTINLQVFTDGSNDRAYGLDDHDHRDLKKQITDEDSARTGKANLPLSLRWETSVMANNVVKAKGTWHWPRLCKGLAVPAAPYKDNLGSLIHHNHVEGLTDERNCNACIRAKNERDATIRT